MTLRSTALRALLTIPLLGLALPTLSLAGLNPESVAWT